MLQSSTSTFAAQISFSRVDSMWSKFDAEYEACKLQVKIFYKNSISIQGQFGSIELKHDSFANLVLVTIWLAVLYSSLSR